MDTTAKQKAVEKLKQANNILVTVSSNPSVDELSAALGLSLLLDKLGKHTIAVFSGKIPPAISFLKPDQTFKQDVSGLRDFIIALDKDKADKLRYKVEGNVVKIFITPYKSAITKDDLRFEEGDFNVDAVVALGVSKREDLDNAIKAHGRILHDATVITVNAGDKSSNLGSVNWNDPNASSICEMLVSISESFGSGLVDSQIATAFLTGIVAATERFSNNRTTPKVMTMAAQLMAAGANQQLIADNLAFKAKVAIAEQKQQNAVGPDGGEIKLEHSPEQDNAQKPTKTDPSTPEKSLKQLEDEISSLATKPPSEEKKGPKVIDPLPNTKSDDQTNNSSTTSRIGHINSGLGNSAPSNRQPQPTTPASSGYLGQPTQTNSPMEFDQIEAPAGPSGSNSYIVGEAHNEKPKQQNSDSMTTSPPVASQPPSTEQLPSMRIPDPPTQQPTVISPDATSGGPNINSSANDALSQESSNDSATLNIDLARKEVEEAINSQPFSPDNNPLASINTQPLPQSGSVQGSESEQAPPSLHTPDLNNNSAGNQPIQQNEQDQVGPKLPPPVLPNN